MSVDEDDVVANRISCEGDAVARAGIGRLGLLASALAGRTLQVAAAEPGAPAWTDGRRVFVDPDASRHRQLEALAVQASLLAAGSLEPDVIRPLARRAKLARRYLALEGHRALAVNQHLLPPPLRTLIDRTAAARSDSPAESLAAARGREVIADPPLAFGAIHARSLLATSARAGASGSTPEPGSHPPPDQVLIQLERADDDVGAAADAFSNPGGAGGLGRLLRRMLEAVRRIDADGPPGSGSPTHRARAGMHRRNVAALSTGAAGTAADVASRRSRGTTYPEWDVHRQRYRPDWCTVREIEPRPASDTPRATPHAHGIRRSLARLGMGLDSCHRQLLGDEIDLDAAIEARADAMAGSTPDEAIYVDSLRRRRDLAALLLLDVSGSVAEAGATPEPIHEQQRAAAGALTAALHDLGDRVALYAFHSQGRSAVHLLPVKRFDDRLDATVLRRLHGLVPYAYSRLGAAIRHGGAVLQARGGTARRLLVVLSDGLAYDHGYERVYGAADARRALAEVRRQGTGCLCLSIGASIDADALRRVFDSAAHAAIPRLDQLRHVIGPLFRAALRSAEVRRR